MMDVEASDITSEDDPCGIDRCWFCGKQRGDDLFTCGSLACLTEWDDITADEINHNERLIKLGVWKSVRQLCSMHGERLSLFERIFHTVKLWICCLLGWHKHIPYDCEHDPVDVVEIDFHRTYAGWDQTWLRVGYGVFSNWHYELMHDSEWNM